MVKQTNTHYAQQISTLTISLQQHAICTYNKVHVNLLQRASDTRRYSMFRQMVHINTYLVYLVCPCFDSIPNTKNVIRLQSKCGYPLSNLISIHFRFGKWLKWMGTEPNPKYYWLIITGKGAVTGIWGFRYTAPPLSFCSLSLFQKWIFT